MKSKTLSDRPGAQVHVVILDAGEEAFATLTKFANEAKIAAAALTAIGAFESAVVGWFDFYISFAAVAAFLSTII